MGVCLYRYRIIPAHIYISLCVLSWGILASLQSVSISFTSLLILRFLLGVSEAAFGPGVPYYLSFFYRRDELAFRTGLFISAAPLASSFTSSLAWLITEFAEGGPIAPWRLLFLAEGFPSVVAAIVAWECVPDGLDTAMFLNHREREVAMLRVQEQNEDADEKGAKHENKYSDNYRRGKLIWREIGSALADPKTYTTAVMFFSANVAFSSMPVFLPTIIREMGHTTFASQALSAPPYLLSFVTVLLTAHLSDKHRLRSPYILLHSLLAASGYLLIALAGHFHWAPTLRYIGVYPACVGFFSVITLIITWTLNNQQGESAKGTGMVILGLIGRCGPLLGIRLYPKAEGPEYVKGMSICAVFMAGVGILAVCLALALRSSNLRAQKQWAQDGGQQSGRRQPFTFIL
ncbi:MFS general substrate transporter [Pseudovirgaria hyperparasitica]|uniref:MFS general substrate transporter n=1 Tax=Pseudovirgaria hyperparasitica TaxID=470096 RepID=A0A6A6VXR4_9PEZI|nr:MFS general substrate transporter [Pseudovirgaria hyperparasitica]KAF2754430.1 MFS general substrate transporter [Pseudovirgaria hyperparasitica]